MTHSASYWWSPRCGISGRKSVTTNFNCVKIQGYNLVYASTWTETCLWPDDDLLILETCSQEKLYLHMNKISCFDGNCNIVVINIQRYANAVFIFTFTYCFPQTLEENLSFLVCSFLRTFFSSILLWLLFIFAFSFFFLSCIVVFWYKNLEPWIWRLQVRPKRW